MSQIDSCNDSSLDSIFATIEPTAVLPQRSGPVGSLASRMGAKPIFRVVRRSMTQSGAPDQTWAVSADTFHDAKIDADLEGSDDKSVSQIPSQKAVKGSNKRGKTRMDVSKYI